ncbi:MAG: 30S ribosomal protein S4 [SAR202 cluster bacterium]|nr:30S ribosomal protein S4 [SAR202 cluster bacterium]
MARYIDPVCRQCRRAGEKLFLKGERCFTPRCAVERRKRPPGDPIARRRRVSDWGVRLREKQKARNIYGVLERQFRNYFDVARTQKGATGDILLQILESRLDNVVYRLCFADSRAQARQFVGHGHFTVNGKNVNIPSFMVKPGDVIAWRPKNGALPKFAQTVLEGGQKRPVPAWLQIDSTAGTGQVISAPEIGSLESGIDARLIVEFYSR